MEAMILSDEKVESIVMNLKNNQFLLEHVTYKYNKDKPYLLVTPNGRRHVISKDEFFENIHDNLLFSEFSWLNLIIENFKCNFEANVSVDLKGNFDHENIELKAVLNVPQQVTNIYKFLYPRFQTFVRFQQFVQEVEIAGYKGNLINIIFRMELNGKLVSKIIKENKVNQQLLSQWLYCLEKCERDNVSRKRYAETFKVVNGKIKYETKQERLFHYFDLKKEMNENETDQE